MFGTAMKRARIKAGYTQRQLAKRAYVSEHMISAIENGYRQPSLPILITLADALGITIDEYIGHTATSRNRQSEQLREHQN